MRQSQLMSDKSLKTNVKAFHQTESASFALPTSTLAMQVDETGSGGNGGDGLSYIASPRARAGMHRTDSDSID